MDPKTRPKIDVKTFPAVPDACLPARCLNCMVKAYKTFSAESSPCVMVSRGKARIQNLLTSGQNMLGLRHELECIYRTRPKS